MVRNPVEAAYMRSDLFERRRRLTADWVARLGGPVSRRGDLIRPRHRDRKPFRGGSEAFRGIYGS